MTQRQKRLFYLFFLLLPFVVLIIGVLIVSRTTKEHPTGPAASRIYLERTLEAVQKRDVLEATHQGSHYANELQGVARDRANALVDMIQVENWDAAEAELKPY